MVVCRTHSNFLYWRRTIVTCNSKLKIAHRMRERCISPVSSGRWFYNNNQLAGSPIMALLCGLTSTFFHLFDCFGGVCMWGGGGWFNFLSLGVLLCLHGRAQGRELGLRMFPLPVFCHCLVSSTMSPSRQCLSLNSEGLSYGIWQEKRTLISLVCKDK